MVELPSSFQAEFQRFRKIKQTRGFTSRDRIRFLRFTRKVKRRVGLREGRALERDIGVGKGSSIAAKRRGQKFAQEVERQREQQAKETPKEVTLKTKQGDVRAPIKGDLAVGVRKPTEGTSFPVKESVKAAIQRSRQFLTVNNQQDDRSMILRPGIRDAPKRSRLPAQIGAQVQASQQPVEIRFEKRQATQDSFEISKGFEERIERITEEEEKVIRRRTEAEKAFGIEQRPTERLGEFIVAEATSPKLAGRFAPTEPALDAFGETVKRASRQRDTGKDIFTLGIFKAVARKPLQAITAPTLFLGKAEFATAALFEPAGREELKSAIGRVPRAVASSFDPRTPEGLVNIAFTAASIKAVQQRASNFLQRRKAQKIEFELRLSERAKLEAAQGNVLGRQSLRVVGQTKPGQKLFGKTFKEQFIRTPESLRRTIEFDGRVIQILQKGGTETIKVFKDGRFQFEKVRPVPPSGPEVKGVGGTLARDVRGLQTTPVGGAGKVKELGRFTFNQPGSFAELERIVVRDVKFLGDLESVTKVTGEGKQVVSFVRKKVQIGFYGKSPFLSKDQIKIDVKGPDLAFVTRTKAPRITEDITILGTGRGEATLEIAKKRFSGLGKRGQLQIGGDKPALDTKFAQVSKIKAPTQPRLDLSIPDTVLNKKTTNFALAPLFGIDFSSRAKTRSDSRTRVRLSPILETRTGKASKTSFIQEPKTATSQLDVQDIDIFSAIGLRTATRTSQKQAQQLSQKVVISPVVSPRPQLTITSPADIPDFVEPPLILTPGLSTKRTKRGRKGRKRKRGNRIFSASPALTAQVFGIAGKPLGGKEVLSGFELRPTSKSFRNLRLF